MTIKAIENGLVAHDFTTLPVELTFNILKYLSAEDLTRTARVCRLLRDCSADDSLWKSLCKAKDLAAPKLYQTFRQKYQEYALKTKKIERGDYTNHIWATNQGGIQSLEVFNEHLYSGSEDGTICKWNEQGHCIQVLTGHQGWVQSLTVFNGHLYSGSVDGTIRKWDDMGKCIQVLTSHQDISLRTVLNDFIYSGSIDGTIRKRDGMGKCIQVLTGHQDWVRALTMFNGHLYSGSDDKTIRKWDDMGNCIQMLTGHQDRVRALTVFNGHLYSGSVDGTIRIWA